VVSDTVGREATQFIDAARLATRLMGHSIATNIFMLGHAFQCGLIPLSLEAILRAIELNGAAVEDNVRAFHWGRRAAHDPAAIDALLGDGGQPKATPSSLDELIAHRRQHLVAYQDEAYAQRYLALVQRVRDAERKLGGGEELTTAVARNFHKLLAYKDEFEVARLFAEPGFDKALAANFEGDYRLNFHITLPWSRGATPGAEPKKIRFGPWLLPAMKLMARFKFLRGTALNPFGRIPERIQERALITDYESTLSHIIDQLSGDKLAAAIALASLAISSTDKTFWMSRMITNLPAILPMPAMKSARILAPKAGRRFDVGAGNFQHLGHRIDHHADVVALRRRASSSMITMQVRRESPWCGRRSAPKGRSPAPPIRAG
jgi:indolepyruvate ferredoxin oxidoreductase